MFYVIVPKWTVVVLCNLFNKTREVLPNYQKHLSFIICIAHFYKIMFVLPVMKDCLFWETTQFSCCFIEVWLQLQMRAHFIEIWWCSEEN